MAVLSRDALEGSPLADLHVLARELGIDGFRRLRKADLVEAIIARQAGEEPRRRRRRRPTRPPTTRSRGRGGRRGRGPATPLATRRGDGEARREAPTPTPATRRRRTTRSAKPRRRGGREPRPRPRPRRGRPRRAAAAATRRARRPGPRRARDDDEAETARTSVVEGTVELLGNGSGFLRVSAAGALRRRRLHLRRPGPPLRARRAATRSPARSARRGARSATRRSSASTPSTAARPTRSPRARRSTTCPCAFPTERLALGAEDPTLKAIEWLTPLGRGSRATIVGGSRAGKSEALRRLGGRAGRRTRTSRSPSCSRASGPEEVAEWKDSRRRAGGGR